MKEPLKYDTRLQAVSDALDQVEAPGDYCTMGNHASYPPPGLVVDGVGDVLLPLTETTAKTLISASHLAPYGHGELTLVDTQVRNTWELPTSQFTIENPAFDSFVKHQIAEACRGPLGIHESVVFEAKLYKLLLYETGGKFERHQDSEKENGMFGTLVVVLPGRFEGGELVVHHPSAADESKKTVLEGVPLTDVCVFDAGVMDPFSLKYAAFYGDCPHEVKPVTKGYRLCLTYNLVKIASPETSGVIGDPRFGSNHVLYAAMKDALEKFFRADGAGQTKRQRVEADGSSAAVGFDVTNLDMYRECKLVYVLTHKYTQANLSFNNLKNRDAAAAASLARFCDSSDGALGMYLCKMQYIFSWHGNEGTMYSSDNDDDDDDADGDEYINRELDLLYPWVDYKKCEDCSWTASANSSSIIFSHGDLTAEVAPCDFFNKKGFKFDGENSSSYTGNEGASSDRWYGSAAIVVAPLQMIAKWNVEEQKDPTKLLEKWLELANLKPAHARAIARAFQGCVFTFSATSPRGVRVLDIAAQIDDLDLVCAVVAAFRPVTFQPKLRDVLARFDASVSVKNALSNYVRSRGYNAQRSTINFVASILDGETKPSVIAAGLDTIKAVPYVDSTVMEDLTLGKDDTTPVEFARVLKLASLVSMDHVESILGASSNKGLVLVVAPAIQLLFDGVKDFFFFFFFFYYLRMLDIGGAPSVGYPVVSTIYGVRLRLPRAPKRSVASWSCRLSWGRSCSGRCSALVGCAMSCWSRLVKCSSVVVQFVSALRLNRVVIASLASQSAILLPALSVCRRVADGRDRRSARVLRAARRVDGVKDEPDKCAVVVAIANHAVDLLKQKMPTLGNSSYMLSVGCSFRYTCGCEGLRTFMKSLDEEATFGKKSFEGHIKGVLKGANCLSRFSVQHSSNGSASTVVLKKTYQNAVVKMALEEIAKLEKLAAEFVRFAVVSGDRATHSEG